MVMNETNQNNELDVNDPFGKAEEAAKYIADRTGVKQHDIALVLGSGWGGAAELIGKTVAEIPAHEVPGFSKPAVEGHVGLTRSIELPSGKHALVLGSRTHYYEGRGVRAVAHGIRTAAATGAKIVVLTNGCGGLHPEWTPGQPVLISDHIHLTAASPLEGATFVDLTDLYAAREAGMEVLGISLVTNPAAGISKTPLSHEEVIQAGQAAGPRISDLLANIVRNL